MAKMLVIADDLSGAAEIAGIGHRFGLPTRLLREPIANVGETMDAGVTVLDTDSRLLAPADAAALVGRLIAGLRGGNFDLVFKKTDSALRGPILAEVETIMDSLGFATALLVPQNPSRGRTIEDGEYRIDGVPLDRTSFASDPIHPARSADVLELLGRSSGRGVRCLEPPSSARAAGDIAIGAAGAITVGAARTIDDVRRWAGLPGADRTPGLLPVGGADFFDAVLRARGMRESCGFIDSIPGGSRLFVCGSASRDGLRLIARAQSAGIPVCAMADDSATWQDDVLTALETTNVAVVFVGRPLDLSPGAPQRIEAALADVVARVLERRTVDHLFLEGGATASAVCRRMGWHTLAICGELAGGVVQMQGPDGQRLTVKPGSYTWPEVVWR